MYRVLTTLLVILALYGCSGGGGSSGGPSQGTGTGTITADLTDATTDAYRAVYVTVEEIRVQEQGEEGWTVIARPGITVNLLDLVNGKREPMGGAVVPAATYAKLRVIVAAQPGAGRNVLGNPHPYANYLVTKANQVHELKVPSGMQSGIKIDSVFTVQPDGTTALLFDFDACKSIVQAGNSGKWLLKPRIKVIHLGTAAVVTGNVVPVDPEGVLVALQRHDPLAPDPKDRTEVVASTVTDQNGAYTLLVDPGTYTLVGYKDGYSASCASVIAPLPATYRQDLTLTKTRIGTVTGTVTIAGANRDAHATLSFRQRGCGEVIEVTSTRVANLSTYSTTLPAGTYQTVASTDGEPTQVQTVTVTAGGTTRHDVRF